MNSKPSHTIAIIGGGPAGLMAAEMLSARGFAVTVYDRKPSVGRKFLMAGRGGLNLTHSEDLTTFIGRYGAKADVMTAIVQSYTPAMLRTWCEGLGQKTFVGTSGRIFPESFKASPLLSAWLKRLSAQNVVIQTNHDWKGWDGDTLVFSTPEGITKTNVNATLLALGGASWPRLGTDGSWVDILKEKGISITPLQPANSGFIVEWSPLFRERFAGEPLKSVALTFGDKRMNSQMMITEKGVEGGGIYALSSAIREEINKTGSASISLDLKPGLDAAAVEKRLKAPRGRDSFSNHLRKHLNLSPVAVNILMEQQDRAKLSAMPPAELALAIKNCLLTLIAPSSIDRAISTAGGIMFDELDDHLMLRKRPGVFAAGEMLDWEAPTGGYLLQACFATGVKAAEGIASWLDA